MNGNETNFHAKTPTNFHQNQGIRSKFLYPEIQHHLLNRITYLGHEKYPQEEKSASRNSAYLYPILYHIGHIVGLSR